MAELLLSKGAALEVKDNAGPGSQGWRWEYCGAVGNLTERHLKAARSEFSRKPSVRC